MPKPSPGGEGAPVRKLGRMRCMLPDTHVSTPHPSSASRGGSASDSFPSGGSPVSILPHRLSSFEPRVYRGGQDTKKQAPTRVSACKQAFQRLLNCGARRAAFRPYSSTLSPETLVFTWFSAFSFAVPSLINYLLDFVFTLHFEDASLSSLSFDVFNALFTTAESSAGLLYFAFA